MNLFPEIGSTNIDLSSITFEEDYIIPASGTIASGYQKGFEMTPEIKEAWNANSHEVAAEFIMSYYRSKGFDQSVEVFSIAKHDDCIGGVLVTVRDKSGLDYMTYGVWESLGRFIVEDDRRPPKI